MKCENSQLFFSASAECIDVPRSNTDGAEPRYLREIPTSTFPVSNSTDSRTILCLQEQININSRRDRQLWITVLLVLLIVAFGLVGVLLPGLLWKTMVVHLDLQYLPQLLSGMTVLLALFSVYVMLQRREVSATHTSLIQALLINAQLRAFSMLDPVTQLLNACAIESIATREIARANRVGSALTFSAISLDNHVSVQKRIGGEQNEQAIVEAARLLKATFRGSDAIFRSGPAEFLVVMPDTNERQAENALSRLRSTAERWNAEVDTGVEVSFSYGIAAHAIGGSSSEAVERARRCLLLSSQKINVLF